jgi:hypothetical protein
VKAVGVLIIGLGLILIVIGVTGTQSNVLADMKGLNPKLRAATGTKNLPTTKTTGTTAKGGGTPGGTIV